MKLFRTLLRKWQRSRSPSISGLGRGGARGKTIVIIMDGTLSSLVPGHETNAGLIYRLLQRVSGKSLRVYYQPGIQMPDWLSGIDVLTGKGINRKIKNAYGVLANWYKPGDRIFLVGFSRGAYAVRSLAGVVEHVGLVREEHAIARNMRQAYRHYRAGPGGKDATDFRSALCHDTVPIQAIGVFDTVKALGVRLPLVWRAYESRHNFHNAFLGASTKAGFHALAADERRLAYAPVLWTTDPGWSGTMQQMWFAGTHSDIGGHVRGASQFRPFSNIPLVWMLQALQSQGLTLPADWQDEFPTDASAPSLGAWSGNQKFFLSRRRRQMLNDPSEELHATLIARNKANP